MDFVYGQRISTLILSWNSIFLWCISIVNVDVVSVMDFAYNFNVNFNISACGVRLCSEFRGFRYLAGYEIMRHACGGRQGKVCGPAIPFFSPLPSPHSPYFPSPSFPSPPLPSIRSSTPYIQLGTWGSAVSYPARSGAEPQPESNLVHFSLKMWHMVAIIFYDFPNNQRTKFNVV